GTASVLPNQRPKFLNRFFIFHLDPQRNPPQIVAESISIGRHCFTKKKLTFISGMSSRESYCS
ncbi:MAG: hypothetical protein WBN75_17545, partial [Verrucomicrobiia bacterium]